METFLDILKYVLPSVITFLTAFFLVKKFLERDYQNQMANMKGENQKMITPLRLQAYERLILLMERTNLSDLITRTHKSGMSARMLHSELLKTIRNEFDHNIAQQLYVTNKSWDSLKTAKEETIKTINIAASHVSDTAPAMELVNVLFDIITKVDRLPTEIATDMLKMEARQLF
jgi:hypothetical protein